MVFYIWVSNLQDEKIISICDVYNIDLSSIMFGQTAEAERYYEQAQKMKKIKITMKQLYIILRL